MKRYAFVVLLVLCFITTKEASAANEPSVIAFTANPQTVSFGLNANFYWEIFDGSGASIQFNCPEGIKINLIANKNSFPCNTLLYMGQTAVFNLGVYFTNSTGSSQTVPVFLIPRGTDGKNYPSKQKSLYVTIGADPTPVLDFRAFVHSTTTNPQLRLNWKARSTDGVNFIINCDEAVQLEYNNIPVRCNVRAFSKKLVPTGSININILNSGRATTSLDIQIMPAIFEENYDGTHSMGVNLYVPPKIDPKPTINSLTASNLSPISSTTVKFSWKASNTNLVNLQFSCPEDIQVFSVTSTTSAPLKCDRFITPKGFATTSSTTVTFLNRTTSTYKVTARLFPASNDGTFDGTRSQTIDISVKPIPEAPKAAPITYDDIIAKPVSTSTKPTVKTVTPTTAKTPAVTSSYFTQTLKRGSRGAEVTNLQKVFMRNPQKYYGVKATGVYDLTTEQAVKIFQVNFKIARRGDANYGVVDAKTRTALNKLGTKKP